MGPRVINLLAIRGRRKCQKRRSEDGKRTNTIASVDLCKARSAIPYLRSIVRSLRERLDIQTRQQKSPGFADFLVPRPAPTLINQRSQPRSPRARTALGGRGHGENSASIRCAAGLVLSSRRAAGLYHFRFVRLRNPSVSGRYPERSDETRAHPLVERKA